MSDEQDIDRTITLEQMNARYRKFRAKLRYSTLINNPAFAAWFIENHRNMVNAYITKFGVPNNWDPVEILAFAREHYATTYGKAKPK